VAFVDDKLTFGRAALGSDNRQIINSNPSWNRQHVQWFRNMTHEFDEYDLSALILSNVRAKASHYIGEPVKHAIVTGLDLACHTAGLICHQSTEEDALRHALVFRNDVLIGSDILVLDLNAENMLGYRMIVPREGVLPSVVAYTAISLKTEDTPLLTGSYNCPSILSYFAAMDKAWIDQVSTLSSYS
jgi:hypothetical protein